MGRRSDFSQKTADTICDRLAEGESLRSICKREGMPAKGTVMRWLAQNKEFQDQYARAREAQADAIFDEILDIADDATNDWMLRNSDEGDAYQVNGEHIQRSRVRIDARKWMAGKLRPKVYGDKLDLNHGTQPGDPLQEFFKAVSDGSGRIGTDRQTET